MKKKIGIIPFGIRQNNQIYFTKIIMLLILLSPVIAFTQKIITGKVFDASNNKPLAMATISVRGSTGVFSTITDGTFNIKIAEKEKVLFVSYVGYETQTVKIDGPATEYAVGLYPLQDTLQQITVIGSRNLLRTRVETPVPVDIIPVAKIAATLGQTDLNQLLTYAAPSFHSARQAVADGTDHIDPAQLRGLGSDQVLVLVNGKRRHQSALVNVNGTVNRGQVGTDLNSIPLDAIERVEILRDGAAAQYGSDAIAGVINIVLKKSVNSISGNISYGENITRYDKNYALEKLSKTNKNNISVQDGNNFEAGLNYGFNLNNKGFINLTGTYALRDKSNRAGTYTGAVYANVAGTNKDDSILSARGLTRESFDMRIGNSKIVNSSFVANSGYDFNKNWSASLFASYSEKNGEAAGFFRYPSSITTGAASFAGQVLAIYPNGFLPLIKSDIKDISVSVGLNGKPGKWNISLSNTLGTNIFDFTVDNSINYTQLAITDNPQTKFDAGGLQFVQNTINADVTRNFKFLQGLNVAYGAEYRIDQYAQHAGEEASYKNFNTTSSASPGAQVFAGFVPDYAKTHTRHNVALYADFEQDFTNQWLLESALRFENYTDFGSTLNYKVATRYKFGNLFSIRAAASSGFRAPSLQQQFYAKTNTLFVSSNGILAPVESGTFTNDSRPAEILGIPKLKEETSQNYSAGFTTTLLRGLDITVDGYLINIKNRIVLTNNFNGGTDTALTKLLKDNGATAANFFTNAIDTRAKGLEAVLSYHKSFSKGQRITMSAAASFIKNEVKKGADGKPLIKASEILINSGQLGNYFNREDQSRIEVANPASKGNFTLNYFYKKMGSLVRFSYFGKVTYLDPTINPANPNSFPVNGFTGQKETLDQTFSAKTVTDISLSYDLGKDFTFTAGTNNLFDVYQDKHTHSGNVSLGRFIYSRRVEQMGFNGRYVFARLSFNVSTK